MRHYMHPYVVWESCLDFIDKILFAKFFIYSTIVIGIILVFVFGAYLTRQGIADNNVSMRNISFVIYAVGVLLCIAVFFLRKKIAFTVILLKESCRGVQKNPGLFLVSLIIIIVFLVFMIYWITTSIYLYSIKKSGGTDNVTFNDNMENVIYFLIFVFYWVVALLVGVYEFVIGGAIARWYFTRDYRHQNEQINSCSPTLSSLKLALTKSLGSLAFGSLILAIVKTINYIIRNIERKAKLSENRFFVCMLSCLKCLCKCVEVFVGYMSKYAYIYMAIYGESFCKSAKDSFNLISRNAISIVVIDVITDFVLWVGQLLGVVLCTWIMIIFETQSNNPHPTWVTIVYTIIISFTIFHVYSKIIGTGVDAVFVCYLEDLERNNNNLFASTEFHTEFQDSVKTFSVNA